MSAPKKPRLDEENVSLKENDAETTGWFDIPYEMRKIVIDEMNPKTRCRFTICSRKCEEEAKMSEKYLKSIRIHRGLHPELHIGHEEYKFHYCLEFIDINNLTEHKTIVIYKTDIHTKHHSEGIRAVKWMKMVDNETAEDLRLKYLREIVEKYQKTIETFSFCDPEFVETIRKEKFDLKKLENLDDIEDESEQIDLVSCGLLDVSQITGAYHSKSEKTNLEPEDLMDIDSLVCRTRCEKIDQDDLLEFLGKLRNGEIARNLLTLSVNSIDVGFRLDIDEIAKELDSTDYTKDRNTGFGTIYFNIKYEDEEFEAELDCNKDSFDIDIHGR